MAVAAGWRGRAALASTGLFLLLSLATSLGPLKLGLAGQYFFAGTANAVPVRTTVDAPPFTAAITRVWPPPVPQAFTATWTGALLITDPGDYTFATVSDDGSHLFIDGRLVVDNGGAHAAEERRGSIVLARGVHAIFMDFDQRGGAYQLDLLWGRDRGALSRVPASVLAPRRIGAWQFRIDAAIWRLHAVAVWLWIAALVVLLANVTAEFAGRLRRTLEREGVWAGLKWVLAGSTALNAAGTWWGLPARWVAIELTPKAVFEGLTQHFSHGWFDAYPPLQFYLLSIAMAPVAGLARLGWIDLSSDIGSSLLVLMCRLVSLGFGAGIVISVARCGARAFGARAGVLGAAVFALVAPFLYYAKTANTDVPYLFWFAVSMVFYLRVLDHLRLRDFILFAAAATASVCTKDQAYGLFLLMPVPIGVQLWREHQRAGRAYPIARALVDGRLAAGAVTAVVLFAAGHNLLFNFQGFRDHVAFIVGPGSVSYQMFDPTIPGRLQLLRLTANLIQQTFGWPAFVTALAGLALALGRRKYRRAAVWLLVPAASYYLSFIDVVLYNYDRFVLPIDFALAMCAGLALDRSLAAGTGFASGLRRAAVAGLFAYTTLYSSTVDILMIRDSRYVVGRWLADHVGRDDLVATIFDPEYQPRLDAFRTTTITTVAELEAQKPAYYVLNADYARAVPPDSRAGVMLAGLQGGSLGYRVVFRYRRPPPFPWLPGAHHDLTGPREERRVFGILRNINPTIEVYQRRMAP